jgi:dihydropyrimidine dehydrogenase (NAD+) subunit PreA
VKEVARVPVWAKLTPATSDIVVEAGAVFRGGGDAVSSSNTFPSIPLIDPDTLEFEMNVDGRVSSGGLGGPAILPQALALMSQMTRAFPRASFSGIGGISDFGHALNYFLLGCGTIQVCTAAMLDHAVGPNIVRRLLDGACSFFERNAERGWKSFNDISGLARERVVAHSQIRRPQSADYRGGFEHEGYSES